MAASPSRINILTSRACHDVSPPAPKRQKHSNAVSTAFNEMLSIEGLEFLLKITFCKFISYFDDEETPATEDQEEMTAMQQYGLMREFCQDALNHAASDFDSLPVVRIRREYAPSKQSPTGRIFVRGERHSGLGLQRLWGKLRAVLTRNFTTDFDMKNAHPTILLSLVKRHFPGGSDWFQPLQDYIDNRSAVFDELSTHNVPEPKVVVLKALNSQSQRKQYLSKQKWRPIPMKCRLYYALDGCFKRCQQELCDLPQYEQLVPAHSEKNRLGKFVNKLLCQEENVLLQAAIAAVGNGNVVAPMFDGFLGTNTLRATETLDTLNSLPECIDRGIKWDCKQHNSDIQVEPDYVENLSFTTSTDVDLVNRVCSHLHCEHRLACCHNVIWYTTLGTTETFVIGRNDSTTLNRALQRMIADIQGFELVHCAGGMVKVHESMTALESIARKVLGQAPVDDKFEDRYWSRTPNDNYSRGIDLWNQCAAHLLQKSVFLYEESNETEELKPSELQQNMSSRTDITFEQWVHSRRHRVYDKDVFVPSLKPDLQDPRHYNRFKGLAIQYKDCKDTDKSVCKPLLHHIRAILCNKNNDTYDFVLKTWARILQGIEHGRLDWVKSQVCILFLSKQGAGKGTVTRHMRRIFGQSYACQITKKKDLFGTFNDFTAMGKIWVELDELLWGGNPEQACEFKNMITEDEQTCEGKYKKTRTYDSYHNYSACTNSAWAADVESSNRRFAPIDCSDKFAGPSTTESREYFSNLNDPKSGPYTISLSFAKYLYELPVDDFVPSLNIPCNTEGMKAQKLQSLDPVATMVLEFLEVGIFAGMPTVKSDVLWHHARDKYSHLRNFPDTQQKFYLALQKILTTSITTTREGTSVKTSYKHFAPRSVTRAEFNTYIGFEYFEPEQVINHLDDEFWKPM